MPLPTLPLPTLPDTDIAPIHSLLVVVRHISQKRTASHCSAFLLLLLLLPLLLLPLVLLNTTLIQDMIPASGSQP
jgi:hypothetical protein